MKVMTDRVFKGIEVKNSSVVVGGIQIDDKHTTVTFSVNFLQGILLSHSMVKSCHFIMMLIPLPISLMSVVATC